MVFVERARERRRQTLLREPKDLHDYLPARSAGAHLVSSPHGMTWLRRGPVQLDVSSGARLSGGGP